MLLPHFVGDIFKGNVQRVHDSYPKKDFKIMKRSTRHCITTRHVLYHNHSAFLNEAVSYSLWMRHRNVFKKHHCNDTTCYFLSETRE